MSVVIGMSADLSLIGVMIKAVRLTSLFDWRMLKLFLNRCTMFV
jgi:hypothetical protein